MIRGALILAAGFGLGYAKGLKDSEIVAEKIVDLIEYFEKEKAKSPGDDVIDGTATEETADTAAPETPSTSEQQEEGESTT